MAKDGQGTPVEESSEVKSRAQRLVERMAQVEAAASSASDARMGHILPAPDMPIIRPGGQMVMGSRAPVPSALPIAAMDGINGTQLFSSAREERGRISGGAAVALACAVAVGTTAVLSTALNQTLDADYGKRTSHSKPVASANDDLVPSRAAMTPSYAPPQATQVASLAPVAIPQQLPGTSQKLVRVAKKDATGFIVENVSGTAGSQLPVKVSVQQENPEEYSFLMFRGLPADVSLSAGFRLKDSWAVSLRDLENLALVSPADFEGSFEVEVMLIKGRNTPADSRVIIVDIQGAPANAVPSIASTPVPQLQQGQPAPRILTAAPPAPSTEPKAVYESAPARETPPARETAPARKAPAKATPRMEISADMEASMLERASNMLENGDVSSARLLLEHVAKKGSGRAALALARTYDPSYFKSMETLGLRPNPEKAKEWYAVAADLGQEEARSRLGALSGSRQR